MVLSPVWWMLRSGPPSPLITSKQTIPLPVMTQNTTAPPTKHTYYSLGNTWAWIKATLKLDALTSHLGNGTSLIPAPHPKTPVLATWVEQVWSLAWRCLLKLTASTFALQLRQSKLSIGYTGSAISQPPLCSHESCEIWQLYYTRKNVWWAFWWIYHS